ncbi:MAG: histidine kinase [Pseudomonadota bacterium]
MQPCSPMILAALMVPSTPCRASATVPLVAGWSGTVMLLLGALVLLLSLLLLCLGKRQAARLAFERHLRDIAEHAASEVHAERNLLRQQVKNAREAERLRIARDIHDDLGQNLLALKMELSMLQLSTAGVHPLLHQRLANMAGGLERATSALRGIIKDLRPAALEAGLEAAMRAQLDEFTRLSGVAADFDADSAALAAAAGASDALLLRVLQEALANVARHAHATRVRVNASREAGMLLLRVADNGVGLDGASRAHGQGLHGMRERAHGAGGRLDVATEAGHGTTLTLAVPLAAAILAQ